MVRTHLHHRKAVLGAEPREREGHADVVVQVAFGRQRRADAPQDRRGHLLDRGLAVAPGHTHQGDPEAAPPVGGEPAEGLARVDHPDHGQRGGDRPGHERRGGAALPGALHEIVTVDPGARQRDEERARRQGAGVHPAALERHVRTRERPAQEVRRLAGAEPDHERRSASSTPTTAWSL